MVKKLILAALMIGLAVTSYAGSVTLAWDPYTDVADGIRIYASKTSPVAITPANKIGETQGTAVNQIYIANLKTGRTYFVATAYGHDESDPLTVIESAPSNEAFAVIRPWGVTNLQVQ